MLKTTAFNIQAEQHSEVKLLKNSGEIQWGGSVKWFVYQLKNTKVVLGPELNANPESERT